MHRHIRDTNSNYNIFNLPWIVCVLGGAQHGATALSLVLSTLPPRSLPPLEKVLSLRGKLQEGSAALRACEIFQ